MLPRESSPGAGGGEDLLKVKNLSIEYTAGKKIVHATNNVSFEIKRGESLALVGESGCGKSTIAKGILRILPDKGVRISGGEIWLKGKNLVEASERELEHIRGAQISMVFQDPMTALNPVKRIITQVASVIQLHKRPATMWPLYGGEVVEYGSKREIFKNLTHPYTIGLFGALPSMISRLTDSGRSFFLKKKNDVDDNSAYIFI